MSNHPLLELKGVSKRFGGVEALTQIDFQARAGEVMALVGDNGAGKSTLIKGIAGIYPFDKGQVYFDGQKVKIHSPRDSANLGIEVVYQDLALADNLDVVSNMYLGRETTNTGWRLDEAAMEKGRPGHPARAGRHHGTFGAADDGRVVWRAATGRGRGPRGNVEHPAVVILDEPTAALGVAQTRQVLDLVRRLADKGLAVILISHNLHEVFEVADRITVLRLGQKVAEVTTAATSQQEIVHAITAGTLDHIPGMAAKL